MFRLTLPALAIFTAFVVSSSSPIQNSRTQSQGDLISSSAVTQNLGVNTGVPFCDPMDPNSSGLSTTLTGSFSTLLGSGLHLEVTQGPVGQFGYFRVGTAANDPGIMIGQGRMCLSVVGGNIFGRYTVAGGDANSIGRFDSNGVLQNLVGTSSVGSGFDVPTIIPISGGPMISAGDTWHFQVIHRENGGTWNYSNGLSVTFP